MKTSKTTNEAVVPKVKKNRAVAFAIAGWVIIAVAIILTVGFMLGKHYAEKQNAVITSKAVALTSSLKQ